LAVRRRPPRTSAQSRKPSPRRHGCWCALLSCTPPRLRGEQICLHKMAGGWRFAQKNRYAIVEDDRKSVPKNRVGWASPDNAAAECRNAGLHHDAGRPVPLVSAVPRETVPGCGLTVETKSSIVFRSTATHASIPSRSNPGWQRPPQCTCQPGIERIRFLLARVDDDGGRLLARTGQERPQPPAGTSRRAVVLDAAG